MPVIWKLDENPNDFEIGTYSSKQFELKLKEKFVYLFCFHSVWDGVGFLIFCCLYENKINKKKIVVLC